ncbi:hypothetical protein ACFY1P_08165 [Streptomyces sp. NPDC001407]|uniref:hypothetical protein n=1 Tax=Streptomyces sp. NPDC001407 TaxID=3364573 RepID=UPI0036BDC856
MRVDPAEVLVTYLESIEEFEGVFISADAIGREVGTPSVICDAHGGERTVRGTMDRFDFTINTYGKSKREAAGLAYAVREYLLESLPNQVVLGSYVADVVEIDAPASFPDDFSREARFIHSLSIYVFEVDPGRST